MGIEQEALDDTFDPRQLGGIDPMHDVTSIKRRHHGALTEGQPTCQEKILQNQ
jgi:hypothetical protein